MYFKKPKRSGAKGVKKTLAMLLCLSLLTSPLAILSVWGAVATPSVTNGALVTYQDNGITNIASSTDVFVNLDENTVYYYDLSRTLVDVYYVGDSDNPVGSYFSGSLTSGNLVTTISAALDKTSGTLLSSPNGAITVPKPEAENPITLRIVAYKGDEASKVYEHTFKADSSLSAPVITDGGSLVYANNGQTGVSGSTDVFVSAESGVEYYYLFEGETSVVEIYYDGETDAPAGSYFDGPFVKGALVGTIGATPGAGNGKPVTAADNWKISIPYPSADALVLKVAGYKGGWVSPVYTHTFARKGEDSFTASLNEGVINANFANVSNAARSALYAAVYNKEGVLVSFGISELGSSGSLNFAVGEYPLREGYSYKVFLWNENYIPAADAIVFVNTAL